MVASPACLLSPPENHMLYRACNTSNNPKSSNVSPIDRTVHHEDTSSFSTRDDRPLQCRRTEASSGRSLTCDAPAPF